MSQLPERERRALIVAYADGHQHQTISRMLGVCDRSVINRLAKARRHLANILGRLGLL